MKKEVFDKIVTNWYSNHKRDLPWRNTTNPYHIWLSEIMLQQTRVNQGLPYFLAFTAQFSDIFALANAPEQEVLRLWQGLGYYSRARNLHATAKHIAQELQGKFPPNYLELLKLKGVGSYTAAAIASFAYHEKVAVLDGNVFRVLSRYFGITTDIASPEGAKEFSVLANKLLPDQNSSTLKRKATDKFKQQYGFSDVLHFSFRIILIAINGNTVWGFNNNKLGKYFLVGKYMFKR